MSRHRENQLPEELHEIDRRLKDERPEASDLELDRMKVTAMARGSRRPSRSRRTGKVATSRLLPVVLALGLLGGGTGALAASGAGPFKSSSSSKSASEVEYCENHSRGNRNADESRKLSNQSRTSSTSRPGRDSKPKPKPCDKD